MQEITILSGGKENLRLYETVSIAYTVESQISITLEKRASWDSILQKRSWPGLIKKIMMLWEALETGPAFLISPTGRSHFSM